MQKVFWTRGTKVSEESLAPCATLFCTRATWSCTGAQGFSPPRLQRPFAPSPNHFRGFPMLSAAAFWGFSRGGFPENACIEGAISERHFCEICRRKSPQNTEKHKTKLCAEVPERPLPKDPFFQLLILDPSPRCSGLQPFHATQRDPEDPAVPFVRIHSGNNSKIIFLCICICYEMENNSKTISICNAGPPLKTAKNSCVCICYENEFQNNYCLYLYLL